VGELKWEILYLLGVEQFGVDFQLKKIHLMAVI
jgi:hypothetical protein